MRQAAFLFTLLPIVLPTVVAQRPGQPARSWLHGAVLDRSPLVVRAQLDSDEVLPLHEIQVTRFKVLETLKGRRRKHVLVGAAGERGGAFKDLDKVLFLKPLKSGSLHELIDIIDLTSRDSETVPATLRAYFRIAREARPAPRNRALFDLSMSNVGRQSIFATRVAFNELLRLADQAPHLFKPQHLEQLERSGATAPRVSRPPQTRLIRRVSRLLGAHFRGAAEVFPPGPARAELRQAIERFRRLPNPDQRSALMDAMATAAKSRLRRFCEGAMFDEAPVVRARAAWYLGDFGMSASVPSLIRHLGGAAGDELKARIEALGKIGHAEGLKPVLRFMGTPETVDSVLLAIARIGGLDAQNILDRAERSLVGRPGEEERLGRIRYYRSDSFATTEAKRRREAKKAWL